MRYRELIENTDDDDLFGGSDRRTPTPEQAIAKFKMIFPINKRVSWSKMHFGTVERLFGFTSDSRFHAGQSLDRHSYWGTQAYTNRQTGMGMLIYEDSGQSTWVYLGANDREDFARMIQQLIAADQLEDPEAAKQRRLEKQQRRAAAAEKKGIRVGAKIQVSVRGEPATAEVVSITKGGKLNLRMIDGPDAGQLHPWQPSAHSVRKADVIGESDDDDDMFATPKIAFNAVFNEYDEDELIERGFEYGDNPEQDIEILNDYLEGYRDFRVVGLSGGEHDLVLHLDRSSKLAETNDDELFGSPSFNAEQAGKLIATTGATSGELVDPESIQNALEHAANRVLNSPVIQNKAREQLEKWMAIDDDTQWELVDEIANMVYEINGDGWEPEDTIYNESDAASDDDLFGRTRMWYVNIWGNYNDGRYYDYGPRRYTVPGTTARDALNYLNSNADLVHAYMDTQRFPNNKRVVARPAKDNVFLDRSTVEKEAPEGFTSAIDRFIRSRRALQ